MTWKATGEPTVRKQRGRWVVRVDGVDSGTGQHRPRQLGTYETARLANLALRAARDDGNATARGTLGWAVTRFVESRTDVSTATREQYAWAAAHISAGIGGVRLDRLDRADLNRWLAELAAGGRFGKRSLSIFRHVLRMALNDAVDEGLLTRSPANRLILPRTVAKQPAVKAARFWEADDVTRFLRAALQHRLAAGFRLAVLYGLRRSELLALRWDDVDLEKREVRVDEGLVATDGGHEWSDGKNERSRRTIPIDEATARALARHRKEQAADRLVLGSEWRAGNLVFTSEIGTPMYPRNFDRALERLVKKAGVPRLTSHGLRHTAATHMVAGARDLGDLRAVADILGHSPDILLRIYAHAVPSNVRAVADRIGAASASWME